MTDGTGRHRCPSTQALSCGSLSPKSVRVEKNGSTSCDHPLRAQIGRLSVPPATGHAIPRLVRMIQTLQTNHLAPDDEYGRSTKKADVSKQKETCPPQKVGAMKGFRPYRRSKHSGCQNHPTITPASEGTPFQWKPLEAGVADLTDPFITTPDPVDRFSESDSVSLPICTNSGDEDATSSPMDVPPIPILNRQIPPMPQNHESASQPIPSDTK